jgi:hypothetical protein
VPLLTEGDLDRGRPPDLTSHHWRCGIVDPATGAVCTRRLHGSGVQHYSFAAVQGGGRDRRLVTWSGGSERALVVEHGYTWTRVPGTEVAVRVLADRPVALRYKRHNFGSFGRCENFLYGLNFLYGFKPGRHGPDAPAASGYA